MRILRSVLRIVTAGALVLVARTGESQQSQAFCGYCASGTQCPDLNPIQDQCPIWCGAETYLTGCTEVVGESAELLCGSPNLQLYLNCWTSS